MQTKDFSSKVDSSICGDLLHCVKDLARIEKKYRPKMIALMTSYWDEIDALNEKIDRAINGKSKQERA